ADNLQILGRRDDLFGDLGGRPDGEAVILADDLEQLVLVLAEIRQVVDLDAVVLEDLHGGFAELVRNENLGHCALLEMLNGGNAARSSRREEGDQAAALSAAFSDAKAQSSQTVSALRSAASIVEPAQMRRPVGASR